ncbi:MAG: 50S ribosomal protein L3 [Candidatus Hecatellales archaeon]|nr:MAG: 50S ribosomal protein L3 [Candidatus Hecatellales archaeon]
MGHRRKSAPRRGSMAFRPRVRAKRMVARIRYWPEIPQPKLLGFAGYKAGMTYGFVIEDNKESPNYGKEVFCPITVLDTPPLWVCAVRAYEQTPYGLKTLTEVWSENLPKDLDRVLTLPENLPPQDEGLKRLEENLDRVSELRVIVSTVPREAGIHKKKPELMEIPIGGKDVKEKFEYAKSILGKRVSVSDVFSEGEYVDVSAITKGKGFAGPVKRFGVHLLQHKSRKTKRGVGCIGPWSPATVMYTVPRAGQLGFFQRTEYNKRILKIGSDGSEITPKGGFHRYGVIRGPYMLLKGSVPGPVKRLIRLRHAVRGPETFAKPQITYIHVG